VIICNIGPWGQCYDFKNIYREERHKTVIFDFKAMLTQKNYCTIDFQEYQPISSQKMVKIENRDNYMDNPGVDYMNQY
jgi:hypothetical protein